MEDKDVSSHSDFSGEKTDRQEPAMTPPSDPSGEELSGSASVDNLLSDRSTGEHTGSVSGRTALSDSYGEVLPGTASSESDSSDPAARMSGSPVFAEPASDGYPASDARDSVTRETPFMAAAFSGKNSFWRYFLGLVLPFIVANIIGAIPLVIITLSSIAAGGDEALGSGGMPDFEKMGVDPNLGFLVMVFPFVLALLTIILLVKPLHGRKFMSVVNGGRRLRWDRILIAALVWIAVSVLWLFFSLKGDPDNFRLNNTSGSLLLLAVLALLLIPLQAAFEEVIFRGYLMQGFAVLTRNRWLPILLTSVLFGFVHGLNPEVKEYGFLVMMPQYIFFGLVFAIVTMMDDGIELAIGAHAANNVFLSVMVTHKDSALQTAALYEQLEISPWHEFAGLVIMSLLFLLIMAWKYRWRSAERLFAMVTPPA